MISRELKIGIIGGVISSILVLIFIEPLLGFLWHTIISFGEAIHAKYIDRIYQHAAIEGYNQFISTFTLLLVFISLMTNIFLSFPVRGSYPNDKIRKLRYLIVSIPPMLFLPFIFIFASINLGVTITISSFNQRIAVLSPSISDQEYKEWKARWVMMKGIADYRSIVTDMDKRALALNIELPKLREP
jgi:hypothetical protein